MLVFSADSNAYLGNLTTKEAYEAAVEMHNTMRKTDALLADRGAHYRLWRLVSVALDEAKEPTPSSFWLSMLMPADKSADIIANMEELYREVWLPKYGQRKANWI
ncbi:hypothetical protein LHFGNBLO_000206 [Mesorhizobium sp. AR10]|uniref:hypothetical protein n=1 Tax=Mesorhizobium sp. AR10 TaxID=2865839 RepID=UPI00215EE152|nr:hypothetical protein [Mesorhizobium sp. AR10]UVK38902.1 hypothetical protein LHFGNBLO_000206 [Mesorhizobium sp. AR10]